MRRRHLEWLELVLGNQIYIAKEGLHPGLPIWCCVFWLTTWVRTWTGTVTGLKHNRLL